MSQSEARVLTTGRYTPVMDDAARRLADLAHSIPGDIYRRVLSPDGEIFYSDVAGKSEYLYGVDAETVVARPGAFVDALHPEDRDLGAERSMNRPGSWRPSIWNCASSGRTAHSAGSARSRRRMPSPTAPSSGMG